eukprot:m.103537 g.103537  ORF g.103537 m.103537 type:complete len:391 (+) comp8858_c0_seq1:155-1327(+)
MWREDHCHSLQETARPDGLADCRVPGVYRRDGQTGWRGPRPPGVHRCSRPDRSDAIIWIQARYQVCMVAGRSMGCTAWYRVRSSSRGISSFRASTSSLPGGTALTVSLGYVGVRDAVINLRHVTEEILLGDGARRELSTAIQAPLGAGHDLDEVVRALAGLDPPHDVLDAAEPVCQGKLQARRAGRVAQGHLLEVVAALGLVRQHGLRDIEEDPRRMCENVLQIAVRAAAAVVQQRGVRDLGARNAIVWLFWQAGEGGITQHVLQLASCDDAVDVADALHRKVVARCLQLLVQARHDGEVVDLAGGPAQPRRNGLLDKHPGDLLRRPCRADVRQDLVPLRLLGVADPPWTRRREHRKRPACLESLAEFVLAFEERQSPPECGIKKNIDAI